VFKSLYKKIFKPKRVLFYRDFVAYYGGHQKVADYFAHLESSFNYRPEISFSEQTCWEPFNPWFPKYQDKSVAFNPTDYDFVFLAGMDWQMYLPFEGVPNKPVINLIQGVRHGDPKADVHQFLLQKAIRICVSQPVADAIQATGKVSGPIFTIPNGHEPPELPIKPKVWDVIIVGAKQPAIANDIYTELIQRNLKVLCFDKKISQRDLYEAMNLSKIAILLPLEMEGFYLPALEAMKYCDLVIVPDCIGNREFCRDNQNCLMPEYDANSILVCADRCLQLLKDEQVLTVFKQEMIETLKAHTLANERKAFLRIMDDAHNLWAKDSV
jgi:glycosyltransferase involved in cell wall biosynthesis